MMHQHHPHHLPRFHSPLSSSSEAVDMDPRVWGRLPQPLVDRVLACLPTPSFLRLRATCRRFCSLIYSSPFLHSHLLLSPHLPFFAFAVPSAGYLLLLDPTRQAPSWSRLPLPLPAPGAGQGFSPAAASAGLLAFLSDASGHKTLLLANPITRLLAPLPLCPTARLSPTVGLAAGPTSFIAVIAGDDLVSPFAVKNISADTFVADAASVPPSGFWAPSSILPRLSSLDPRAGMAFASGRFYCMSSSPFAVLVFDVAANVWSKVQPPMRRFLRSPALVEFGGGREREARVALVSAVEKSRLSVPRSVRMWTLRGGGHGVAGGSSGSGAWTEVARMPADVHAHFAAAEGGRGFECAAHGDFVVLAPRGPASPVLVFDSRRDEWRWAPPCPYNPYVGGIAAGGPGFRVFAYEPRLATPAIGLLDATAPAAFLHGMQG
ncbi:protein ABERRANT PANICLE ORGANIZATION 1 [Zea mays]|uniref:Protein UNUSUAL FLORAL ORGANS n=1 Tax=Zea mays TaxID=4577 RepID=K7VBY2_MAIZE|nr:protein ABERRANT PANICLE ORGANIZATION 1 [Zea mays]AQL05236.1 Protein UNUSUAL FLORAL ORGANS [Zea mays]|eukprot:XP_008659887.1 protein UNUSUAL FLORAL ORGANS [Zea mays]